MADSGRIDPALTAAIKRLGDVRPPFTAAEHERDHAAGKHRRFARDGCPTCRAEGRLR
jgi:hypothetical protein